METFEHKAAGDQIRIETFNNPYLRGSSTLNPNPDYNLNVTVMQLVDGIPIPLNLNLSAGDIVALAGDYYTKAGWGNELQLPTPLKEGANIDESRQLIDLPIQPSENNAFNEAYHDLASPSVKRADIERIYTIEKTLPSLLQQLVYSFTVKNYGAKLENNVAHFAPWSLRAYLVGHDMALKMANSAYICQQLAKQTLSLEDDRVPQELRDALNKVDGNPEHYKLSKNRAYHYKELSYRYHALAISYELFTLHFYSDHFAGGHLSRIGLLRTNMPKKFGVWGSILINNMHNEDNTDSVTTTNSFQFMKYRQQKKFTCSNHQDDSFEALHEDCQAYGDGTYLEHNNDENSNMLINGMDNSLGDIAHVITTGHVRQPQAYGGLTFLPEIDYTQRQAQPLLIQGEGKKIFFRKDVRAIKILSPIEYKATLKDPASYGYQELTKFRAFLLVFKLRVLDFYYSPKIKELTSIRKAIIKKHETSQKIPKRLGIEADLKNRNNVKSSPIPIQPVKQSQVLSLLPKATKVSHGFSPFWSTAIDFDKLPALSITSQQEDDSLSNSGPM